VLDGSIGIATVSPSAISAKSVLRPPKIPAGTVGIGVIPTNFH